jgi:hypothetical protein
MKKATQWLQELKTNLGNFKVEMQLDKEDINKLHWLKEDDRNLTAVSQITLNKMLEAFVKGYTNQKDLIDNPHGATIRTMQLVGYAWRDDIADRIRKNRKDIPMRPLTKEYVKNKGNNRIGYLNGDLLRAIASCKVLVLKTNKNA